MAASRPFTASRRVGSVTASGWQSEVRMPTALALASCSALSLIRLFRLSNQIDRETGNFASVIAAELRQPRDPARFSAVRARSCIGGELLRAVRREDRGIDVGITVVPEADAITPDGVVVE